MCQSVICTGPVAVCIQVVACTGASPAATAMFEDSLRNLRQVILAMHHGERVHRYVQMTECANSMHN